MAGPWRTINFYKKLFLPVVTWDKKIFIEASCTNSKHTGETFFIVATFEGL